LLAEDTEIFFLFQIHWIFAAMGLLSLITMALLVVGATAYIPQEKVRVRRNGELCLSALFHFTGLDAHVFQMRICFCKDNHTTHIVRKHFYFI